MPDDCPSLALAASGERKTAVAPPFRAFQPTSVDLPAMPGYEVIAELGRGGMGVVYQARQCALNRMVAIKMILAGMHADSTARARFRTEAEAAARLQHPNVVQIYEVGEHHGRPFLVLEYLDGGSLLRKVAGTAQPEQEAARLVETLARAVHAMHQRGILHRDLKPNNILLTADGTPKIADFGLAKVVEAGSGPTRSDALLGTPSYMAPEQAAGNTRNIGASADVYSLGAILYELLTGRAPFLGTTPLSTLEQVRTQDPTPPRRLRRSVSRDLETICLKCLEKEPSRRYSDAQSLADDLQRFLEGQPIQARPVPVWQHLWRSLRRRPAPIAWALGAATLMALLLTAWCWARAADQLGHHRAEEKHQQFVQHRNDALFYGLLAADDATPFLRADAAANVTAAERAARKALALAGVEPDSAAPAVAPSFPVQRRSEVAADCYSLLLVLSSLREQQPGLQSAGFAALAPRLEGKEHYQDALRLLDSARRLGFQTRSYHLRRARFLDRLGEHEAATQERDRAASLTPEDALDHFLAGEEHYRRGEWELAVNSFNRALSVEPSQFWAQFFLAVCHLKLQHWDAAKASLNACLTQQPDFVWAYLFRSFANEKLQAHTEAEADFQKALDLNPNEDALYVLFLTRGILRFNQRDLERAAADFRSALALKPQQYNAYLNLAQVHLAQRQFDEAATQMQTALRLQPPIEVVSAYHVERGRNLLRDQRYEEAVQACETARDLSPNLPSPHEVLGRALLALERYEQAEHVFDEYQRKGGPQNTDLFRGRGLARMKLGRYAEAAEDYSRALDRAPHADLYQHRGWAHFFADAWKLALRDFSKAIELDPEAGDARTGRGLARAMLGQYREAVADAEAALDKKPRTPEMMHNIARIFAQAVACAEADRQVAQPQSLVDSYCRRALDAVHQTLAMLRPEERLSFWQDKILPDAALTPIRNHPEFQRLKDAHVRP